MSDTRLINWVIEKLGESGNLTVLGQTPEGFLSIQALGKPPFQVLVIGEKQMVTRDMIVPFFDLASKPDFVLNVPAKAIWEGPAIDFVHAVPAAFGSMGDLNRASSSDDPALYRFKNYAFVENGIKQHSAVSNVSRIYDRVFCAHRTKGDLIIALVSAYEMSAENIRETRGRYGKFDIALKDTSYGGISNAAHSAAATMDAEACMWGDLMRRLAR